jgi:hypothetical protein
MALMPRKRSRGSDQDDKENVTTKRTKVSQDRDTREAEEAARLTAGIGGKRERSTSWRKKAALGQV